MKHPKIPFELDKTAPQLKGMVTTSTGEKVPGHYLVKIKDKNGWYEFFETHSPFSPDPWHLPYNISDFVKVGNEWYDANSEFYRTK